MQVERSNDEFSDVETQLMIRELRVAVTAMLEAATSQCRPDAISIFDHFRRYYKNALKKIAGHDLSTPTGIAAAERHTKEIRKVSAACLECMRYGKAPNIGEYRTLLSNQHWEAVRDAKSHRLH